MPACKFYIPAGKSCPTQTLRFGRLLLLSTREKKKKQGFRPRLVDWEQDAALIAPAVDKVLGYSCRRCGYLHWWEFLGAFHGIGDGLFAQVVNIRNKRARGKMLDKSEQEFARENAAVIKIHAAESAEDKAEKERLLDLLGR